METVIGKELSEIIPYFLKHKSVWASYDEEVDVLYVHYKKPNNADDTVMTEDDVIIRYEKEEVVGVTILNASNKIA